MVKIMENPIKMDDLGGKPTIFGNPHSAKRFGFRLFLFLPEEWTYETFAFALWIHRAATWWFFFPKVQKELLNRL